MSKEKSAGAVSLFNEFFQGGLYKRSQGRVTRQVTFAIVFIAVVSGAYRLMYFLKAVAEDASPLVIYAIPGLVLLFGVWISYRLVNITRFADFLIAVEAEMNKVTWPTRTELVRSSSVVIIVIFFLASILFGYDIFWQFFFTGIGVLQ